VARDADVAKDALDEGQDLHGADSVPALVVVVRLDGECVVVQPEPEVRFEELDL